MIALTPESNLAIQRALSSMSMLSLWPSWLFMSVISPKYHRTRFIKWLPTSMSAPPPVSSLLNHHSGTGTGAYPSSLWKNGPHPT